MARSCDSIVSKAELIWLKGKFFGWRVGVGDWRLVAERADECGRGIGVGG